MREANLLNALLKPTWPSFMRQTRQELGSYTPEDVRVEYVNKDAPPPDDLLDIACVMYTLDGNVLTFYG